MPAAGVKASPVGRWREELLAADPSWREGLAAGPYLAFAECRRRDRGFIGWWLLSDYRFLLGLAFTAFCAAYVSGRFPIGPGHFFLVLVLYVAVGRERIGTKAKGSLEHISRSLSRQLLVFHRGDGLLLDFWSCGIRGRELLAGTYAEVAEQQRQVMPLNLVLLLAFAGFTLWGRGWLATGPHWFMFASLAAWFVAGSYTTYRHGPRGGARMLEMVIQGWESRSKSLLDFLWLVLVFLVVAIPVFVVFVFIASGTAAGLFPVLRQLPAEWFRYPDGLAGAWIGVALLLLAAWTVVFGRRSAAKERARVEKSLARADAVFETYIRVHVLKDPDAQGSLP